MRTSLDRASIALTVFLLAGAGLHAQAPVITNSPALETWWQFHDPRDPSIPGFSITATNSPTGYGATGLPPGTLFDPNRGFIAGNDAAPGVYAVTFSATNPYGTGAEAVRWVVDPAIQSIAPAGWTNGPITYHAGDRMTFDVHFSGPVVVSGTPTVALNSSFWISPRQASYASGSGTATLEFTKVASDDDFNPDGAVAYGITLQSGSITGAAGQTAVLDFTPTATQSGPVPTFYVYAPPVITSPLTAEATVGQSFQYEITARNWLGTSDAVGLPPGLTVDTRTGTITGTPETAGSYAVTLEAWNQFYSDPTTATLTLTVQDAPPPPTSQSPPAPPPPPPPSPAAPTPTQQTVAIAPVGSPLVDQPITLSASASSGLAVTFSLVSGNATLSGTTLTLLDTSPVVVRASQPGSDTFAPASADLTVAANKATQQITITGLPPTIAVGQGATIVASASSGLPVTLSVFRGPASLAGNVVTVNGAGAVVIRAFQPGNDAFSPAFADVESIGVAATTTQSIAFAAPTSAIDLGQPIALGAVASSGLPVTYSVVSGPAVVSDDRLTITGPGAVVVRATQAGDGGVAPATADITVTGTPVPMSRIVNLSSRARIQSGNPDQTMIAGFVIAGAAPKRLLLRAVGPTLASFGIAAAAGDPQFRVLDSQASIVAANDDWAGADASAAAARVGAFPLPSGSKDAAAVVTLAPGAYTMQVTSNGDGIALAEVYDASDHPTTDAQELVNLSTRAFVSGGDGALVAGFAIAGNATKRVLIRGVGPTLSGLGVANALGDPVVAVYENGALVAQNDDWPTGQPATAAQPAVVEADLIAAMQDAGAFPLDSGSKDAALVLTLSPGTYSAVVSGKGGASGAAMVEVYELPGP